MSRRPRSWQCSTSSNVANGLTMVFVRGWILSVPLVNSFTLPNVSKDRVQATYARTAASCDLGTSSGYGLHKAAHRHHNSQLPRSVDNQLPTSSSSRIKQRCVTLLSSARHPILDGSRRTRDPDIPPYETSSNVDPRRSNEIARCTQRKGTKAQPFCLSEDRSSATKNDGSRVSDGSAMTRGQWLSSATTAGVVSALMIAGSATPVRAWSSEVDSDYLDEIIVWSPRSEIIKRAQTAGGSSAAIKNTTYPVRFVTYLARLLLNYDKASRELWEARARLIPFQYSTLEVEAVRRDQFAEFAKAVQVGLLDYQGVQGIRALFSLMKSRYGNGQECKRQLAILFSFLEEDQPSDLIEGILGDVDNGQVSSLVIADPGGGYTGSVPEVIISPSPAGKRAEATAVLRETGHLVGIRIPQPGCEYSYTTPPVVRISPPTDPAGVQAEARVVLDKRKGFIKRIDITNSGSGYSSKSAPVTVEVFGVSQNDESGASLLDSVLKEGEVCGNTFTAEAIIDKEVGFIEVSDSGDGYATSVPLFVEIQAPGECGGRPDGTQAFAVGLIATGPARDDSRNQLPLPDTSLTSQLAQMLPSAVADTLTLNEAGQYEALDLADLPAIKAGAQGAASMMFDPVFGPVGRSPLEKESILGAEDYLKLATAGAACNAIVRLVLHPLDCVKTTVQAEMGRSDGDDVLGEGQQERDGGWVGIVRRILNKGGVVELLRGIDVSTILGFILGFIGFGGTEFFKRQLQFMMEGNPVSPVWVILLASALAQLVSCVVTCPVEAVRIRVMTCDKRPEFLSFVGTAQEMLEEKGLAYFWSGLGALCFRELPFAIAKFLTFELVRNGVFELLPAAQESVFSALVVSIMAGMVAGVAGAIVSQPADTVLTRLNTTVPKSIAPSPQVVPSSASSRTQWARSPMNVLRRAAVAGAVGAQAAGSIGTRALGESSANSNREFGLGLRGERTGMKDVMDNDGAEAGVNMTEQWGSVEEKEQRYVETEASGVDWRMVVKDMMTGELGPMGLFSGLGLRAWFFGAAIALQFFAFDYFKALLKVSPDDLKLVLDVFADRLSFYTSSVS